MLRPVGLQPQDNDPSVCTLESTIQEVTPEEAQLWLREYTYQGQRTLRQWWVDALAKAILDGKFSVSTIDFCSIDGHKWLLTNGQHRLHAIIKANKSVTLNVLWKLVDDEAALAREYARADRGLQRSLRDAMQYDNLTAQSGLTQHELARVSESVGYWISGFQKDFLNRRNPALAAAEIRGAIIERASASFRGYFRSIKGASSIMMRCLERAPVLAVGAVTHRYQEEKAYDFWHTLAMDDGLRRGTAQHSLREFLLRYGVREYGGPLYARAVAGAWNAYMTGREEDFSRVYVYRDGADKPITIKGTPYDGKCVTTMRDPSAV